MENLNEFLPSFNGMNKVGELKAWDNLFLANDFMTLIESHESELTSYIENLRRAELLDPCAAASAELKRLGEFISWEEYYTIDYSVYASLPRCYYNVDDFVSHATTESLVVNWGLVLNTFNDSGGGDSLDREEVEKFRETATGHVHVSSLSLVGIDNESTKPAPILFN